MSEPQWPFSGWFATPTLNRIQFWAHRVYCAGGWLVIEDAVVRSESGKEQRIFGTRCYPSGEVAHVTFTHHPPAVPDEPDRSWSNPHAYL